MLSRSANQDGSGVSARETGLASGIYRALSGSMRRDLLFEQMLKGLQIVGVNVGNSPVVKVRVSPMQKLIALVRYRLRGFSGIGRGRPDEEVNEMLTPLVNQRRHRPVIEIIKTATD